MTAPSGLVIFIFFYEEGMERGGDTSLVANMATQAFAAGLFVTDPPLHSNSLACFTGTTRKQPTVADMQKCLRPDCERRVDEAHTHSSLSSYMRRALSILYLLRQEG